MLNLLAAIGRSNLQLLQKLGRSFILLLQLLASLPALVFRIPLVVSQIWSIGVLSVLLTLVAGTFVGMVLGLQGYNTLIDFGSAESLGVLVATSLTRELGPVIAALLFAGRAGSALAAEIGLMKATEQLDGMEMMAIDPIKRVLAPRFLAGVISMPLLAAMFTGIGIIGGYIVGVGLLGVDDGAFWTQMQDKVEFQDDIVNGVIIKSLVFGTVITWTALFQGYDAIPTSEGVSVATTRTVVYSSLAVLGLDFILTALMFNE
jgi:phospholipid/cholesterol/gamma-HCH transport system permease protein